MNEVLRTAMFGKQIQADKVNDALVEKVEETLGMSPTSVTDFAQTLTQKLNSEKHAANVGVCILLGSQAHDLYVREQYSIVSYTINDETDKVTFTVGGADNEYHFEREQDDFMPKPVEENTDVHVHPNKAYVQKLCRLMKPYMPMSNPTLTDYILAAEELLPKLHKEGKF